MVCDRCGRETEVSRKHYISATAFHAPILCVECVVSTPEGRE